MYLENLQASDPAIYAAIQEELGRQRNKIELIASENFVTPAVMEAMGTVLTNKYAEGYPGHRYYGGCEYVDKVETLAIERAKELFGAEHANVQAHSGANANTAVYFAFLKPGDTIMGMNLSHGGHLTHGSPVNISVLISISFLTELIRKQKPSTMLSWKDWQKNTNRKLSSVAQVRIRA